MSRETVAGLASAAAVLFGALAAAAAPLPDVTVAEWADAHRKIAPESGSPHPGDWRTDRLPYLREIMNCMHPDHPARRVSVRGSAQVGKSSVGENWIGYVVDQAPGTMLVVLPSIDEATKYNRVKLQPMIDASPKIRHKVRRENARDEKASTTSFKRFPGGFLQVVTASSSKGLQMVSIRYLLLEEVSEYPEDTDGRGSPIDQARRGLKTFGDRAKELAVSTPGILGLCRISTMFEDGDRRYLYVPCPQCGDYQVLDYDRFQGPGEDNPRLAYVCASCGYPIDETEKEDMVRAYKWIPTRVEDDADPVPPVIPAGEIAGYECGECEGRCRDWQPSFHVWAAYSLFEQWTDIWQRGQDATGTPLKAKTFCQQDLGKPYEPTSDAPDWEKLLAARKTWSRGVVPWPACVLTGFIDVQGDRLVWGLWSWGPGVQGWLVDHGIVAHAPDQPEAWAGVDEILTRSWQTFAGQPIKPDAWGIDTGGNHTASVYDYAAARADHIFACKGSSDRGAPPLGSAKMRKIKDEYDRVIARVPLYLVGNFQLKSDIYLGFRHLVDGPNGAGEYKAGTLHLPDWIDEDYARELTAEVLINPQAEAKGKARLAAMMKPGDRREWRKKAHQANEALDIVVGARALAWFKQIDKLTAEQWARLAAERGQAETDEPDLFAANPIAAPARVAADGVSLDERLAALANRIGGGA